MEYSTLLLNQFARPPVAVKTRRGGHGGWRFTRHPLSLNRAKAEKLISYCLTFRGSHFSGH